MEQRKEAEYVSAKMNGVMVIVIRQAGDTGILYGSVSARDVSEALEMVGYKVDRTQVAIENPIKTLGLFKVRVLLHPEVSVMVTINVARSQEEAVTQAQRGGMVTAADLAAQEKAVAEAEARADADAEEDQR